MKGQANRGPDVYRRRRRVLRHPAYPKAWPHPWTDGAAIAADRRRAKNVRARAFKKWLRRKHRV